MTDQLRVVRRATIREQREYTTKPVSVFSLDQAAMNLAESGFMRPWLAEQVKKALLAGKVFILYRASDSGKEKFPDTDEPEDVRKADAVEMARYSLAKDDEMLTIMSQGVDVVGRSSSRPRRGGGEMQYEFTIPPAGEDRAVALSNLTKQGKETLDVVIAALDKTGATRLNENALAAILEAGRDSISVKSGRDLVGLFKSHYGWTYKEEGLVSKVGESENDDDESEDEE